MKCSLYLALGIALGATCQAQALGSMADVSIIDRDTGAALSAHYYNGEYWVAGRPGARYAIEVHNREGGRLLAVTSVDGVNVVSGESAGWDQAGYVFNPGQEYRITGWRKSDSAVAAFTFTNLADSYAARTGRPANVGVIGVAVFRERQAPTVYSPPVVDRPRMPPLNAVPRASESGRAPEAAAQATPSPAPPSVMAPPSEPASKLGTGHGEREYSHVDHTEFVRLQSQPNEVIRIHYDSLDNLLAMGIIRRPYPGSPPANPFPDSPDQRYVPDPPG